MLRLFIIGFIPRRTSLRPPSSFSQPDKKIEKEEGHHAQSPTEKKRKEKNAVVSRFGFFSFLFFGGGGGRRRHPLFCSVLTFINGEKLRRILMSFSSFPWPWGPSRNDIIFPGLESCEILLVRTLLHTIKPSVRHLNSYLENYFSSSFSALHSCYHSLAWAGWKFDSVFSHKWSQIIVYLFLPLLSSTWLSWHLGRLIYFWLQCRILQWWFDESLFLIRTLSTLLNPLMRHFPSSLLGKLRSLGRGEKETFTIMYNPRKERRRLQWMYDTGPPPPPPPPLFPKR